MSPTLKAKAKVSRCLFEALCEIVFLNHKDGLLDKSFNIQIDRDYKNVGDDNDRRLLNNTLFAITPSKSKSNVLSK